MFEPSLVMSDLDGLSSFCVGLLVDASNVDVLIGFWVVKCDCDCCCATTDDVFLFSTQHFIFAEGH